MNKKPAHARRSELVMFRCSPVEADRLNKLASALRLPRSRLLRSALALLTPAATAPTVEEVKQ